MRLDKVNDLAICIDVHEGTRPTFEGGGRYKDVTCCLRRPRYEYPDEGLYGEEIFVDGDNNFSMHSVYNFSSRRVER